MYRRTLFYLLDQKNWNLFEILECIHYLAGRTWMQFQSYWKCLQYFGQEIVQLWLVAEELLVYFLLRWHVFYDPMITVRCHNQSESNLYDIIFSLLRTVIIIYPLVAHHCNYLKLVYSPVGKFLRKWWVLN